MNPDADEPGEGPERLERLFDKMRDVSCSLNVIEDWLDGEEPRELALSLPDDFSVARRGPLTLEAVDQIADGARC